MRKVIYDKTINFYDDKDCVIMYIDYSTDDCIWFFNSDRIINITPDMELYSVLDNFMNNTYEFNDDVLINYKDENRLIWYSDCYCNPDDIWSVSSVSCLNIQRKNDGFNVWCTKKLYERVNRAQKTFGICFSPAGNGKYSKNLSTGLTLQDDFVSNVYRVLLEKNKVFKK